MTLYRMQDYYPHYRESFGESGFTHIDKYTVLTDSETRVGTGKDILVDQMGRFRYIVVDTEPSIPGKSVLLPIGLAQLDEDNQRIFVGGLTKKQIANLPAYRDASAVDERHESQVKEQYHTSAQRRSNRRFIDDQTNHDRTESTTVYDREPAYYGLSEEDQQQSLKLYEERLLTERTRIKTGEVALGKHVETETAEVSEPVQKERVVIERQNASGRPVAGKSPDFEAGEVAHMEVFEDRVNVKKEPFVREEISMRKERDRDTVKARETLRREELDVDTKGRSPRD